MDRENMRRTKKVREIYDGNEKQNKDYKTELKKEET